MAKNEGISFTSSSIKVSPFRNPNPLPVFPNLPFARQTIASNLRRATQFIQSCILSIADRGMLGQQFAKPSLLCSSSLSLTRLEDPNPSLLETREPLQKSLLPRRSGRDDEERVLVSEVLIRNKDGEELERKDLEAEAATALKACRPNSALTVRDVVEDVQRIIDSGYFTSCMPVAVDTRDGIRLTFQVEPNQEFQGLICEGASVLPSKFLEDAFCDGYVVQEKLSMYDVWMK